MKDYRMTVKLKNNRLLSAIESRGFKSPMEFSKAEGISATFVCELINMKKAPTNSQGELRRWVPEICEALGVLPEDIFSDQQMYDPIKNNSFDFECDKPDLEALTAPYDLYSLDERFDRVALEAGMDKAIRTLTEREQRVIRHRYGIDDGKEKTLEDISVEFGVNRERIRQIESRALRKMRHPSRWEGFDGYMSESNQDRLSEHRSCISELD